MRKFKRTGSGHNNSLPNIKNTSFGPKSGLQSRKSSSKKIRRPNMSFNPQTKSNKKMLQNEESDVFLTVSPR